MRRLKEEAKTVAIDDKGTVFNQDLLGAVELGFMLDNAECVVIGAIERIGNAAVDISRIVTRRLGIPRAVCSPPASPLMQDNDNALGFPSLMLPLDTSSPPFPRRTFTSLVSRLSARTSSPGRGPRRTRLAMPRRT